MSQAAIVVDGASSMYLKDGTQGPGKVLTVGSDGSLSWRATLTPTFVNAFSVFPTDSYQTLTATMVAFRHYFTIGERGLLDGGHVMMLPTAPVQGDAVRVTNTSRVANTIYIGSSVHTIFYWTSTQYDTSTTVSPGSYIRLSSGQTIELTFATKNPSSTSTSDTYRPDVDRWYVTSLCSFNYVL